MASATRDFMIMFDDRESEVMNLLCANGVNVTWMIMIFSNQDVLKGIKHAIRCVLYRTQCSPQRELVLKSLTFRPPQKIKVIIVGEDPIRDNATGLAFSLKPGTIDSSLADYCPGMSFKVLHDVLKDVGYLDKDKSYDCCHEVWAQRGVLLYNASLTLRDYEHWKHFTKPLMLNLIRANKRERLFVLCWGTNAMDVGWWLYKNLSKLNHSVAKTEDDNHSDMAHLDAKCVIAIGDHPTYPRDDTNNYKVQAKNQFKAIRQFYPELFKLVAEEDKCKPDPEPEVDSQLKPKVAADQGSSSKPENCALLNLGSGRRRRADESLEETGLHNVEPAKSRKTDQDRIWSD